jgi:hypothetical protein
MPNELAIEAGQDHRGAIGQEWQRLLHGEEQAADVGVEDLVEMLFGDLAQRAEFVSAGIGEQDVNGVGFLSDHGIDPVEVGELRCIAVDRGDVSVDLGRGLVQLRLPPAGDEDLRAFLGKALRGAETNASAAACDNGDLLREFLAHDDCPSAIAMRGIG